METATGKLFVLDKVDSTNNYAMGMIHSGLAEHGNAYLALEQTSGKGRLGKEWKAEAGKDLMISITLQPGLRHDQLFQVSAIVSVALHKLLTKHITSFEIKWPNDVYWRDRKAAGILIENIFRGNKWLWSVAGIGVNLNSTSFDPSLPNPVSLKIITGSDYQITDFANDLIQTVLDEFSLLQSEGFVRVLNYYNGCLWKAGKSVEVKTKDSTFSTTIKKVNEFGKLITFDSVEREFDFDEISFVI